MTDPMEQTIDQELEERGGKKRTNLIIIIAVMAVLLVVGCVAFYLMVFSGSRLGRPELQVGRALA